MGATHMAPVPKPRRQHRPDSILLLGQFGSGNSGNDGSLEAMLNFLRQVRPDAELCCVCRGPEQVQQDFQVPAIQFGWRGFGHGWLRAIDWVLLGWPRVLATWLYTIRRLRQFNLMIIPGTGVLDDFTSGPWGMPYAVFRWCLCARLCGAEVWFVSIGAGPIHHPVSRWLMKRAASAAHYRSYRDVKSRAFMQGIGVTSGGDLVYPDIAFRLPVPEAAAPGHASASGLCVAVGVMRYRGWRDDAKRGAEIFHTYLAKLTQFVIWLLERGHNIRILTGDRADQSAVDELIELLADSGRVFPASSLVAERTCSLHDLMREIAMADIVVATRFHNIVCALKLGKPTISLGYAEKNDLLLTDMGLGEFCQHIERVDLELLSQQFQTLASNRGIYAQRISETNRAYQERLAQQDAVLASRLLCGSQRAIHSSAPRSLRSAPGSIEPR
jgi:polysaccharide pyruvyl transferase WcaK-like protein